MLGIGRWRPRHLLTAWVAYWAGLVALKLGGAILAVARVAGPNGHGSASGSFGDKGITFTVTSGAANVWTGTSSFSAIALWVAGPPLVLWVVWMLSRPRQAAANTPADVNTRWGEAPNVQSLRAPHESFAPPRRSDEIAERRSPHARDD